MHARNLRDQSRAVANQPDQIKNDFRTNRVEVENDKMTVTSEKYATRLRKDQNQVCFFSISYVYRHLMYCRRLNSTWTTAMECSHGRHS